MKTLNLLMLLTLSACLISSCKKADINNAHTNAILMAHNNPFDSLGLSHNIGLKYALSHKSKSTSTCSLSETYGLVVEGLESEGITGNWPSYYFVESVWSPIDHNIVIDSNYSIAVCANQLFKNGTINSVQLNWFIQLNNIVDQNFGLPSYKSRIETFESDLISTSSMSRAQKDIILIGSSVAKYSGEYWASQISNLKSTQYKWWQWGLIIGADVAGALVGSSGGVAGSISASACCSAMAIGICTE